MPKMTYNYGISMQGNGI